MLPKRNRIRSSAQFSQVIGYGCRAGNGLLVVHYLADQSESVFPLVGFIVSKRALPRAVDRNRIKRQLRAIISANLEQLPPKSQLVVRVLAGIKGKNGAEIEQAWQNGFTRVIKKSQARTKSE